MRQCGCLLLAQHNVNIYWFTGLFQGCMCVLDTVHVQACMSIRVGARDRAPEHVCVCVRLFVCVWERGRESEWETYVTPPPTPPAAEILEG